MLKPTEKQKVLNCQLVEDDNYTNQNTESYATEHAMPMGPATIMKLSFSGEFRKLSSSGEIRKL